MKKAFLVLPLAVVLVNCSSTRNTSTSTTGSGVNASGTTASTGLSSGTTATGATGVSGSTSTGTTSSGSSPSDAASASTAGSNSTGSSKSPGGSINWDVYDPNNFMQNPDKYLKPDQLSKTGGWTYNKDWRRNTNFTPEAVGQWQLVLTPEVAANWLPDTRRPETYASFWTPEAIMSRYQEAVAVQMRIQDSIAALNATATTNTPGTNETNSNGAAMTSSTTGAETTATSSASAALTGSGSTGAMGTGGIASTNATADSATAGSNSNSTIPYPLKAVNGNNYMLPVLNMYIDNGSFTAYTGCNTAVGNIIVNGTSLKFEEASPLSNVECIGGFDQSAFIDRLRRADSYDVVDNQFRLKQGDQVLMVFGKKSI